MNERLKFRMYFFVPYNISPIQQAIQAGHAALEYALLYGKSQEFLDFATFDKTWIILNGGTTNDHLTQDKDEKIIYKGTLNQILNDLGKTEINYSFFREPDLNDALTAICFIADERVWNYKDFPNFVDYLIQYKLPLVTSHKVVELKMMPIEELREVYYFEYQKWVDFMGGDKNIFLRELIRGKRLA